MPKPISIVLKGEYTDRDVKRAIRDLQSLQTQGAKTEAAAVKASRGSKILADIGKSWKGLAAGGLGILGAKSMVNGLKEMASTAIEDQASVTKLSTAMRNLGLASQQTGVEDFISKTMMATGVMDDALRPAFARLLRSTDSVGESQRGLGLALDISAATGKDLDTVANALGKAYDGNAASLGRLGLGLDKATLKSADMNKITAVLQQKFGGSAAAAAGTYEGQLNRLSAAVDEAKESIGYGLLGAINDIQGALGGTSGAVDLISQAGDAAGDFTRGLGSSIGDVVKWAESVRLAGQATDDSGVSLADVGSWLYKTIPAAGAVSDAYGWLTDKGHDLNQSEQDLNDEINRSITMRQQYALVGMTAAGADAYGATKAKELNAEIAKMNKGLGRQAARASVEAAIDAFAGADTQGTRTWKDKHGKSHTSTFTKQFMTDWKGNGFDLTTATGRQGFSLASDLISAVQTQASGQSAENAVKTYARGRRSLVQQLRGIGVEAGDARRYAKANLATPQSQQLEASINSNSNNRTVVNVNAPTFSEAQIKELVLAAVRRANNNTSVGALHAPGAMHALGTSRGLTPAS